MRPTISTLIAVLATLFAASPALAADVYSSSKDAPLVYSAPTGTRINWNGVYIGGQVGYGNANHNLSAEQQKFLPNGCDGADADDDGFCKAVVFTPETDDSAASCSNGGTVTEAGDDCVEPTQLLSWQSFEGAASAFIDGINSSGVFGGGTIGADVQRGRIVAGIFGDYNLGSGSTQAGLEFQDILSLNESVIEEGDSWLVAARLGVTFGNDHRALLYGLGGYGQQDFTYNGLGGSKDVTHSGWVLGAGGEYAVTQNVFVGIEYQHFFGGEETIQTFQPDDPSLGSDRILLKDEVDTDKVMGRIKVKFNTDIPTLY